MEKKMFEDIQVGKKVGVYHYNNLRRERILAIEICTKKSKTMFSIGKGIEQ